MSSDYANKSSGHFKKKNLRGRASKGYMSSPAKVFVLWKDYLNGHFGLFSVNSLSEDRGGHCYLLLFGVLSKYVTR